MLTNQTPTFAISVCCVFFLQVTPVRGQFQMTKLLASDGEQEDRFGFHVAVSGKVALVGAYKDDDNGENAGAAYVYRFNGTDWVEEAKLLASDGDQEDWFGQYVGLSGDVAIVGAYRNGPTGSAYFFRYDGVEWTEEAKVVPSDGTGGSGFGYSVAVSKNVAIIGRWDDDDNGAGSGSAYAFRYDGSTWMQEFKILPSDGSSGDQFGYTVDLDGHLAIVGARHDGANGIQSGSAYIFRRRPDGWHQEAKLLASDGQVNDSFGKAVAIKPHLALVGSNAANDDGIGTGAVYVYRRSGSIWQEEAKLVPTEGEAFDWFGLSVALSGNLAIVGSTGDDDNGAGSGSVYVFRFGGSGWEQKAKVLAFDGAAGDRFGYSVSAGGHFAVVGARADDDNGTSSGSAYIVELFACRADQNGDAIVDEIDLAAILGEWGACQHDCPADVNGDGGVDLRDLIEFIANWGT